MSKYDRAYDYYPQLQSCDVTRMFYELQSSYWVSAGPRKSIRKKTIAVSTIAKRKILSPMK